MHGEAEEDRRTRLRGNYNLTLKIAPPLTPAPHAASEGDASTPWYLPLEGDGGLNVTSVRRSAPGRFVSNRLIGLFERLKVIPEGSKAVSDMLNVGADALIEGGRTGIFTPCFFVLARKPA